MGGMTGLKYEALKDFIKWSTPSVYDYEEVQRLYVRKFVAFGNMFASAINDK
jgi:hypothetical protein